MSLFLCVLFTCATSLASDSSDLPVVAANDNRMSAGELTAGQLTLRLELRRARWYPDRETDPSIALHAFGEEGKPPQIVEKMIEGRLAKFFKEVVLLEQGLVMDPDKTVGKAAQEAGARVVGFRRFQLGEAAEE